MHDLAQYIDHTLLAPGATQTMIEQLCEEALHHHFKAVCVNPFWVQTAATRLSGSSVLIASVIGFPLGAAVPRVKSEEARIAAGQGAAELDMVLTIGALLSGDTGAVADDISAVRHAAGTSILKVILETCLLDETQIAEACRIAVDCGADFVKTSTGFAASGATVEAVRLMRDAVGTSAGVKASGGIRTKDQAIAMIEAGATRIGTSSGIAICSGR